jgi:hypothetical protein
VDTKICDARITWPRGLKPMIVLKFISVYILLLLESDTEAYAVDAVTRGSDGAIG